MIISLRFKNFFSIKDEAVLDFTADMSSRKKRDDLPMNLIDFNGDKFVNIMGLFGSNAAGKSNIIKALDFCRNLVLTSHLNNPDVVLDYSPFKFDAENPSEFQINFVTQGVEYEYEFHIHKGEIVFEQLHHYPKKRRAKVFSREDGVGYSFRKGAIERPAEVEANTGSKTLFISRAASMNRGLAQKIVRFFRNEIVTNQDLIDLSGINRGEFEDNKEVLLKGLEVSDSDIVDIQLEEYNPGHLRLISFHKENPSIPFDFTREESEGTRRLFVLLMLILRKAMDGATIFLDEFDLKLHLRLGELLLDTVRATRIAQMVFTSHNPALINLQQLRPEQIIFVTKQSNGNSDFVALSDFEGLDRISDIRQAYIQGRFDAVPYVGNIYSTLKNILEQ